MLVVTTAAEAAARSREVHVNGRDYVLAEYIGAAPKRGHYVPGNEVNDNGLPQGFLVHQPPNAVTPAHFHEPNQFQVFVAGKGRMGAFPAQPLTVQYANGHTPYGPIVAGEEGVKYFTLRQQWDPGAKYLPAAKDLLRKGNQRTRIKGGIEAAGAGSRDGSASNRIETIFEPEPDGLAAWIWRMPAANKALLPKPADGGGQYLIVAGGTLLHEGRVLDHLSTIYITADEPQFRAASGDAGLDLLVLQFPRLGETMSGGAVRGQPSH
ncbi:MAG: hypothetical protein ACKVP7_29020 [Hyphomicrobiaceae bacterium]